VQTTETVVIGAGPAGLSTAAMLTARGLDHIVIDRADDIGNSWRNHYERLHLHTVRWLSHLPGYRFSRRHGRWVSRDGVVRYLEGYVKHHDLTVQTGTAVERIDKTENGDGTARFIVRTNQGDIRARNVVVATGYNNTPKHADWFRPDAFDGELIHASEYRNASPFEGKDVLVVGSGNTGAEIAVDLVEGGAKRVRMAIRTGPHVVLRESNGLPTQATGVLMRNVPTAIGDPIAKFVSKMTVGDLTKYGMPAPEGGLYTRAKRDHSIPIIDVGLIDCLKNGTVQPVAAVTDLDGPDVILADGTKIQPEAVVVATGWQRMLEPLVGHLGVLEQRGRPIAHGGETPPQAPGLYFTGFVNPVSGMFREMAIDAKRIAKAIGAESAATSAGVAGLDARDGARLRVDHPHVGNPA
jgi:putative flavoprotein involved in K+ transport